MVLTHNCAPWHHVENCIRVLCGTGFARENTPLAHGTTRVLVTRNRPCHRRSLSARARGVRCGLTKGGIILLCLLTQVVGTTLLSITERSESRTATRISNTRSVQIAVKQPTLKSLALKHGFQWLWACKIGFANASQSLLTSAVHPDNSLSQPVAADTPSRTNDDVYVWSICARSTGG